jgi:hypothetical protein
VTQAEMQESTVPQALLRLRENYRVSPRHLFCITGRLGVGGSNPLAPTKTSSHGNGNVGNGNAAQWARGDTRRGTSRAPSMPPQKSDAARRDVAINVIAPAQENDPVTRRI